LERVQREVDQRYVKYLSEGKLLKADEHIQEIIGEKELKNINISKGAETRSQIIYTGIKEINNIAGSLSQNLARNDDFGMIVMLGVVFAMTVTVSTTITANVLEYSIRGADFTRKVRHERYINKLIKLREFNALKADYFFDIWNFYLLITDNVIIDQNRLIKIFKDIDNKEKLDKFMVQFDEIKEEISAIRIDKNICPNNKNPKIDKYDFIYDMRNQKDNEDFKVRFQEMQNLREGFINKNELRKYNKDFCINIARITIKLISTNIVENMFQVHVG